MTTIPSTRTAPWAICPRSCFGKEDRQPKTAGGTGLQGQYHYIFDAIYTSEYTYRCSAPQAGLLFALLIALLGKVCKTCFYPFDRIHDLAVGEL
jgi:hypothetical protein